MSKYNNKKITYLGIQMDSKLELYTYQVCKGEGFNITRTEESLLLQKGFSRFSIMKQKNVKERDITYTYDFDLAVDFLDKPIAIECKGFASKDYPLRRKMFCKRYGDKYHFVQLNSNEDVLLFLDILLKLRRSSKNEYTQSKDKKV